MKMFVSKIASLILIISLSGCAFSVPEKNYLTANNLEEYNMLYPYKVPSRIAYEPAFPNPVRPDHILYKSVLLGNFEDVPEVIRNINIAIASADQFEDAIWLSLRNSNLLSYDDKKGKYYLDVKYIRNDFMALTTTVRYSLRKIGEDTPIFERDFSSQVVVKATWGGMNWEHARRATQLAHMLNISSITWCLEQYDGQQFPDNCDLSFVKLD